MSKITYEIIPCDRGYLLYIYRSYGNELFSFNWRRGKLAFTKIDELLDDIRAKEAKIV